MNRRAILGLTLVGLGACSEPVVGPAEPSSAEPATKAPVDPWVAIQGELSHQDPTRRLAAVRALGELKVLKVDPLVRLLSDNDPEVRAASARTLGRLMGDAPRPETQRVLNALANMTDDRVLSPRLWAYQAITQIQPDHPKSLIPLLDMMRATEPPPVLQQKMEKMLWEVLGGKTPHLVHLLGDLLSQASPAHEQELRWIALHGARLLGGDGTVPLRILVELLVDPEMPMREAALRAIESLGASAESAAPEVVKVVRSSTGALRATAIQTLAAIDSTSNKALDTLIEALGDDEGQVRAAAAQAIGRLKTVANAQRGRLIELVKDPEATVRQAALEALGAVVESLPEVLAALVGALSDDSDGARAAAARSIGHLAHLGLLAQQGELSLIKVAQLLLALSHDSKAAVRAAAINSIGQIGALGVNLEAALTAIVMALSDESTEVKTAAIAAIIELKDQASAAWPQILKMLISEESRVRLAAIQAVGQMGEWGRRGIPVLKAIAMTAGGEVGEAARDVLSTLTAE